MFGTLGSPEDPVGVWAGGAPCYRPRPRDVSTVHSSTPLPVPPHVGGGNRCCTTSSAHSSTPLPVPPHVGEGNAGDRLRVLRRSADSALDGFRGAADPQ